MINKIVFVASVGPADDHRYYYKEIGNICRNGWSVNFFCREIPPTRFDGVEYTVLSSKTRSWTRKLGGLNLLARILKWKPNAVQICSVEFLPLAIVLSIFFRLRVFYDCREDMPTSLLEHKTHAPYFMRLLLSKMTLAMEFLGAHIFSGISVSDHWLESKYIKWGCKNCFLFPNYPRLEDFVDEKVGQTERPFDFCILGSMSERTGVVEFVQALAELKRNNLWGGKARLIGDPGTSLAEKINKIASAENVDLEISGRVAYNRVPVELSKCKVGVIPLKNMVKFHRNPATKMFEYAAAGLYLVATDLPPQRRYLDRAPFAVLVAPDDVISLSNGLIEALQRQGADLSGTLPRNQFKQDWNADLLYPAMLAYYERGMK